MCNIAQCFPTVCRERFPGMPQDFEKKLFKDFAVFVCEISEIRSEDGFFLERTNFGKEIVKKEHEFR